MVVAPPPARRSRAVPLVTLTVRRPKSPEFKSAVLGAVHRALVASGVPSPDLFHRVLELDAEDFRFDPAYPDLARPRSADFVLVEVLLSVGRSLKVKRQIVADLLAAVAESPGLHPEDVMVVFKETGWESWSFGGGRFPHG
jgi:phenylpyruvate tautomerase PptA (4-oxalocrotonate tautomerase family)